MRACWLALLIKLYPAAWRRRYGAEYLVLLEETPLSWRVVLDVLGGALDARLHPELVQPGRAMMKQNRVFRVASVGAIVSTAVLAAGLLGSSHLPEEAAEMLILMSPIALLPMVVALHLLFAVQAPRASRATVIIGAVSMGAFLLALVAGVLASWFVRPYALAPAWLAGLFQAVIGLMGVWLILAAFLGWRTRTLPVAAPALMLVAGLSWLVVWTGIVLSSQGNQYLLAPLGALLGLGLFVWLITQAVWTVWLGVWLWRRGTESLIVNG